MEVGVPRCWNRDLAPVNAALVDPDEVGDVKGRVLPEPSDTRPWCPTKRPDIVFVDRSVRRAMIVEITIPHDENQVIAEKEKVSKYLDLAHEINAVIVPIVVSVNGLLTSFDQV
ncbi:jg2468 [Pararge aegeria aegeria]|uniref:Jg2468 protein n=1 Tax=Pararge aegeria aegeria TaxID=348720 RepID=A0A8S4SAW9_9NEOP|nr:jg2468 [Pararge aegeria aegeria]